jgi:hypothetical protein
VLVAGGIILGLALLADWANGLRKPRRRRCPRCWYDMSGVSGLQCPECGREARHEKKLGKARRRWGWAVVGLLLAAPGVLGVAYPRLAREDWLTRIPSWALVRFADPISPPTGPQQRQLALGTTPIVIPPTRAELMGRELSARYERGRLSLDVRRKCAAAQFVSGGPDPIKIETRDRWPAGVPVLVIVHNAFRGPLPRSLFAAPKPAGGEQVTVYDPGWGAEGWYRTDDPGWLQPAGILPSGTTSVEWQVTIDEGSDHVWQGKFTTPITIGGTIDEVIQPVVLPAAADAIRRALLQTARVEGSGKDLWLSFEHVQMDELRGITVGLVMEFRHDGKRVAGLKTVWAQEADLKIRAGPSGWYRAAGTTLRSVPIDGDTALLGEMKSGDSRWAMAVRGDGATALRDLKATKYWSGAFELTVGKE